MRPEEFSQMLRQRPGSMESRSTSQEPREVAKDLLRQSMEQHATDRREAREHLELSRRERLTRIWQEAGETSEVGEAPVPLAEPAPEVPSDGSARATGFVFEQTQDKEA